MASQTEARRDPSMTEAALTLFVKSLHIEMLGKGDV